MGFVGLIIVLLILAFILRLDFIFYIAYVCVGIFALSRWAVPRALKQLRLERKFVDHAFLGETVTVAINWNNTGRLPLPWVEFVESIPPGLRIGEPVQRVMTISGKEKGIMKYQVQGARRGYYRLGPLRLNTGDSFGLVSSTAGYMKADYLTVYPRIVNLFSLGLPSRLPFGTIASNQRLFEDPARPVGVREYHIGDSQRHINWKVSAHTEQLLVKRFQPAISLETTILLNLHRSDYDRRGWNFETEWAIVVAASLAAHLIDQRQPTGLLSNGIDPLALAQEDELQFSEESGRLIGAESDDGPSEGVSSSIPPHRGREHLMKVLERLARIESYNSIPFERWAIRACLHLSWGTTILAITSRGDEATCQTLHRLVRSGFNPILIAVEGDNNFGLVRDRARRLGFRAFNVTANSGMDLWRQARQRSV